MIVALIKSIEPHPTAHKLRICTVYDGNSDFTVVCGAANLRLHMRSIFAPPGTALPTGELLQPKDIRGIISQGMLCSPKELGVSDEVGIVDLPEGLKLGQPLKNLDPDLISSTPWYLYQPVETLFETPSGHLTTAHSPQSKIISRTYFYQGKYLQRL